MPLYLVRHGETNWNREQRFQSRTDVPLNEHGLAQARAVRDELKRRDVCFVAARCSPMSRAIETARIILEGSGIDAQVERAFTELNFGRFEGRQEDELREEYGDAYTVWRSSEYTIAPPGGGESIVTGASRVRDALWSLAEEARLGNVLVVAHQAVNMAMKVALSGKVGVASAATFRQRNNDVDIWDMDQRCRLEMFSVCGEV